MLNRLARIFKPRARKIRVEDGRTLYLLSTGQRFWLDPSRYLDRCLIERGEFEPLSTRWVDLLVRPGDVVLDVGANIGYYSALLGHKVGQQGKVIAFEPTEHYRKILQRNLAINGLEHCVTTMPYGLSDEDAELQIAIGECSATLHWAEDSSPQATETIILHTLDEISGALDLPRLDFVKVDIDGHELPFIRGAKKTIARYQPIILLEVNHANYLEAGFTAWEFYDELISAGFVLFSEKTGEAFSSRRTFLRECGNFDRSANLLVATGPASIDRLQVLGKEFGRCG